MATAAERMRAHRERARRGLRRFTISVSADDLRVIAEHGYEGAASADQDCRSQALSRFMSDTVPVSTAPAETVSQRRLRRHTGVSGPTVTPSHRRCGATAGVVTASLFGPNVVLYRGLRRGAVRPADASPDLVPVELDADLVDPYLAELCRRSGRIEGSPFHPMECSS